MAVVVVGGPPRRVVQRAAGPVGGQQPRRRHHRVEVVVDRGVARGTVVVDRGASAVAVGVLEDLPRAHRPVGDVELHRAPAAVREVQPVVGAGGRRESRLLLVDRGQQQPVHAEHALRFGIDRIEARLPRRRDVHRRLADRRRRTLLHAGRVGDATRARDRAYRPAHPGGARRLAAPAGSVRVRAGRRRSAPGQPRPRGRARGAGRAHRREHRRRGDRGRPSTAPRHTGRVERTAQRDRQHADPERQQRERD